MFKAPFIPVDSSNIAAVAYDPASMELRIQFKSGAVYAYDGVPQTTHAALMASPSQGKYFASEIKNVYPTFKIG